MRVLVWFVHHNDYNGFRLEELESLATLEGLDPSSLWIGCTRPDSRSEDALVFVNVPDIGMCHKLFKRSILIRGFLEVWAEGKTYEEIRSYMLANKIEEFRKFINSSRTWEFKIRSFGKRINAADQREKMMFFSSLFKGDEVVDLKNPDTTLVVAEQWNHIRPIGVRHTPDNAEKAPSKIFFGRQICYKGKNESPWWWKYRLQIRVVLGPTSLDTELAFLMCNQALLRPGDILLDPFVGTGSILVAASDYKAICIGSDIDIRVLKGYGVSYINPALTLEDTKRSHIFRNFEEYGLPRPEIIRSDNSSWVWRLPLRSDDEPLPAIVAQEPSQDVRRPQYLARSCHAAEPWVDCIITDPPYGIRAGARQSGQTQNHKRNNAIRTNEDRLTYIPPTVSYESQAVVSDLLNLAARLLVDGGRLVFLLPIDLQRAEEELKSLHQQDLTTISASLQQLTGGIGRFLVTMQRKKRNIPRRTDS